MSVGVDWKTEEELDLEMLFQDKIPCASRKSNGDHEACDREAKWQATILCCGRKANFCTGHKIEVEMYRRLFGKYCVCTKCFVEAKIDWRSL